MHNLDALYRRAILVSLGSTGHLNLINWYLFARETSQLRETFCHVLTLQDLTISVDEAAAHTLYTVALGMAGMPWQAMPSLSPLYSDPKPCQIYWQSLFFHWQSFLSLFFWTLVLIVYMIVLDSEFWDGGKVLTKAQTAWHSPWSHHMSTYMHVRNWQNNDATKQMPTASSQKRRGQDAQDMQQNPSQTQPAWSQTYHQYQQHSQYQQYQQYQHPLYQQFLWNQQHQHQQTQPVPGTRGRKGGNAKKEVQHSKLESEEDGETKDGPSEKIGKPPRKDKPSQDRKPAVDVGQGLGQQYI